MNEHENESHQSMQRAKQEDMGREFTYYTEEEAAKVLKQIIEAIKEVILRKQREHKKEYNSNYNVVGVEFFGSFAKGNPHKDSDIDIVCLVINGDDYVINFCEELQDTLTQLRIFHRVKNFASIEYKNSEMVRTYFNQQHELFGQCITVTPHDLVQQRIDKALAS